MAVRRLAPAEIQPKDFSFTPRIWTGRRKRSPNIRDGRQASAVIPLLWRAQEQAGGWVPEAAIRYVADFLDMANIRVMEIATFYTMFNLAPVGRFHVQLCGTTPCMLRGADELNDVCQKRIGDQFDVTAGRQILLGRGRMPRRLRECADGADQLRFLRRPDAGEFQHAFSTRLAAGKEPKPGPQIDRQFSAPEGGPTTLKSVKTKA